MYDKSGILRRHRLWWRRVKRAIDASPRERARKSGGTHARRDARKEVAFKRADPVRRMGYDHDDPASRGKRAWNHRSIVSMARDEMHNR